jgi:site-specific recombinase XerC
VQELLGHESLSTTQIYMHGVQTKAKEAFMAAQPGAKKKAAKPEVVEARE